FGKLFRQHLLGRGLEDAFADRAMGRISVLVWWEVELCRKRLESELIIFGLAGMPSERALQLLKCNADGRWQCLEGWCFARLLQCAPHREQSHAVRTLHYDPPRGVHSGADSGPPLRSRRVNGRNDLSL